jgi:hypothetical protein
MKYSALLWLVSVLQQKLAASMPNMYVNAYPTYKAYAMIARFNSKTALDEAGLCWYNSIIRRRLHAYVVDIFIVSHAIFNNLIQRCS